MRRGIGLSSEHIYTHRFLKVIPHPSIQILASTVLTYSGTGLGTGVVRL